MSYGGSCSDFGGSYAGGFPLLIVLFILLIIAGASCFC
ncbi:YjcZ family sporulation protein [Bacillus paramycoides]|nr:YjcZ family sporulation protein [Bacillus paramycoides]